MRRQKSPISRLAQAATGKSMRQAPKRSSAAMVMPAAGQSGDTWLTGSESTWPRLVAAT